MVAPRFAGHLNLESFFTQFNTDLDLELRRPNAPWRIIADDRPTDTSIIERAGLLTMPTIQEWVSSKTIKTLGAIDYTIALKKWEATWGICKHDILSDTNGLFNNQARMSANRAGQFVEQRVFEALPAGATELGYDGVPFFAATHPNSDGTTQSNIDTAGSNDPWYLFDLSQGVKPLTWNWHSSFPMTGLETMIISDLDGEHTKLTGEILMGIEGYAIESYNLWQLGFQSDQALDATNFDAAYSAMLNFTDNEGVNYGIRPTHIVVGSGNRDAALQLFDASLIGGGNTNTNRGIVEILVTNYIP